MGENKLRIAMITPWKVKCGIFTYSQFLSKAIASLGNEVCIVRLPRFGTKTAEILGMVVGNVPKDAEIVHVQNEYGLYRGVEGEVGVSLDAPFLGGLRMLDKPIVTTMHAVGQYGVDKAISELSDRVITHNEFCSKNFKYPNVIIPHGTNPTTPPPMADCKKALGIDPRVPIVGYLGFIASNKGVETIIEAMKDVKNAGLLIAGGWHTGDDTDYINGLKAYSLKALENRCQWLGYVPDETMSVAYGAMDVLIYPSYFATESGALLLAVSHGKAVIASDIPPFREKSSFIELFTDQNDLASKISDLLFTHPERRKELEEKAKEYAQKNSWTNVAKLHVDLYEQVLKEWNEKKKEKEVNQ